MINLSTITAAKLAEILVPEALFSGPDNIDKEYRFLAMRYHPDRNPGDTAAEAAFKQLSILHTEAKKKVVIGEWNIPGKLTFEATDGKKYRISFVKDFTNGIATGYIGHGIVVYVVDSDYDDLAKNALKTIKDFTFPSDKHKQEMMRYLPAIKHHFTTKDGKTVIVFEKSEGLIRLSDVVEHFGGKLDPKHAAWIMSRMCNLTCYFNVVGLTHNDLSMDNIYICPKDHTIKVIGGWWHSSKVGERMQRRQTGRTVASLPRIVADTKTANVKTDLALVRLLGREILGDATGMSFIKDTTIPTAFATWVREAPIGDPIKDYKRWEDVIVKSFGERRFVKMELQHSDVYER